MKIYEKTIKQGGEGMELEMKVSKRTWKRWLAAIFSICLCLSCFPTTIFAQEKVQDVKKEQKKEKNSDIMTMSYSPETINVEDVEDAPDLTLDETTNVLIQNPGDVQYLLFTPTKDGTYYFYSESELDTYGALYSLSDDLYWIYESNDDLDLPDRWSSEFQGNATDFLISYELKKDKQYMLIASLFYEDEIGNFNVKVSQQNPFTVALSEDVANAEEILLDSGQRVHISKQGEYKWFKFVPKEDGRYIIYSQSDEYDTYGALFEYNEENNKYIFCEENSYSYVGEYYDYNNFKMSQYLQAGKTYYIYASMYYDTAVDYFYVTVTKAKKAESVKVKEVKPYSSMLAYTDNSYGKMTFEISYEGTDEKKEIVIPFDEAYGYDIYGNEVEVLLLDSSLETNWRRKYQGNYPFKVDLYTYEKEHIDNVSFTRTINSFKDYGKTASNMQYGKEIPVGGGMQIFQITAQASGNHVIYYSKGLNYSDIYVYNASENRVKWKNGKKNTRYGKLTKGETYYIVVQSYVDTQGIILLDYYNGATNPNAATKPNAPQKPTPTPPSTQVKTPTAPTRNVGVPASKVSVAKKSISLKKGGKIKLSTIITPLNSTDKLTFTSSKPKVAQVSNNGVVKAKKPGKAKITIRTTSGKTATVTVKVTKNAVKATKVSVKKKLKVKKGTVRFLSYKVNPKNSTDKMKWKSSKKSVVSVDNNGKITAKKKGKAVITVKIGNKKASCKVTVK